MASKVGGYYGYSSLFLLYVKLVKVRSQLILAINWCGKELVSI